MAVIQKDLQGSPKWDALDAVADLMRQARPIACFWQVVCQDCHQVVATGAGHPPDHVDLTGELVDAAMAGQPSTPLGQALKDHLTNTGVHRMELRRRPNRIEG